MRIVRYTYPSQYVTPVARAATRPWAGLESEIGRLFDAALSDVAGSPAADRFPVDLYEDKGHAFVRAELPGLERNDISVEVVDGYLTIEAVRSAREGEAEPSFRLSRSVSLPETVRPEGVSAAYEHGVLTVTLPKKEEAKPRKVTVAVK